jgi:hypothetical protein
LLNEYTHATGNTTVTTIRDVKTHNQIDHILIETRSLSIILDVRSYRAADCDTDHCLVVARVRERLAVNKQRSHRFHMERFNIKKLNDLEGKEQYRVEVSNMFAVLEDLDAEVEINSAWEMIRGNVKISAKESLSYCELKKHKPRFDEAFLKIVAKLQWLQDPSEINGDNLNNIRREASRYFRNKKRGYLKDKINEMQRTARTRTSETCVGE